MHRGRCVRLGGRWCTRLRSPRRSRASVIVAALVSTVRCCMTASLSCTSYLFSNRSGISQAKSSAVSSSFSSNAWAISPVRWRKSSDSTRRWVALDHLEPVVLGELQVGGEFGDRSLVVSGAAVARVRPASRGSDALDHQAGERGPTGSPAGRSSRPSSLRSNSIWPASPAFGLSAVTRSGSRPRTMSTAAVWLASCSATSERCDDEGSHSGSPCGLSRRRCSLAASSYTESRSASARRSAWFASRYTRLLSSSALLADAVGLELLDVDEAARAGGHDQRGDPVVQVARSGKVPMLLAPPLPCRVWRVCADMVNGERSARRLVANLVATAELVPLRARGRRSPALGLIGLDREQRSQPCSCASRSTRSRR